MRWDGSVHAGIGILVFRHPYRRSPEPPGQRPSRLLSFRFMYRELRDDSVHLEHLDQSFQGPEDPSTLATGTFPPFSSVLSLSGPCPLFCVPAIQRIFHSLSLQDNNVCMYTPTLLFPLLWTTSLFYCVWLSPAHLFLCWHCFVGSCPLSATSEASCRGQPRYPVPCTSLQIEWYHYKGTSKMYSVSLSKRKMNLWWWW